MKLIVFSDIHGNNHSFNEFIKDLSFRKDEFTTLFLGDFIGYYYNPNEIIDYCRQNAFVCVLGNHDQYFLDVVDGKIGIDELIKKYGESYRLAINSISKENLYFLRQLDKFKIIEFNNKRVYFCHGSPLDNLEGRIYPETDLSIFEKSIEGYDYVLTGQTHHKLYKIFKSTVFLNPGSLGQQRDGKGCSYMIIDLEKNLYDFRVVEYDIKRLEDEIDLYDMGWSKLKSVLRRKK